MTIMNQMDKLNNSLKAFLKEQVVFWRTKGNLRKLSKIPLNFPVDAKEIKNVLVLLPRDEEYQDSAMTLVRNLRHHFTSWHFMALDVNKIPVEKLDRYNLPNREFIDELARSKFKLVLDLNFELDLRMNYLVGMLKIPYRLHLQTADSDFYNICTQTDPLKFQNFDHVFAYLQNSFIIK